MIKIKVNQSLIHDLYVVLHGELFGETAELSELQIYRSYFAFQIYLKLSKKMLLGRFSGHATSFSFNVRQFIAVYQIVNDSAASIELVRRINEVLDPHFQDLHQSNLTFY